MNNRAKTNDIINASEVMDIAFLNRENVYTALDSFLSDCDKFFTSSDIDSVYKIYRKYRGQK
jgi:hypothetical protein